MVEEEKIGLMDTIKEGFSYISQIIFAGIFPQIAEGTEMVMKTIDDRIKKIETRILKKISSLLIILFGGILLVFGVFFFLTEFLGWSKAGAFFSISIIIFVIGFIIRLTGNYKG